MTPPTSLACSSAMIVSLAAGWVALSAAGPLAPMSAATWGVVASAEATVGLPAVGTPPPLPGLLLPGLFDRAVGVHARLSLAEVLAALPPATSPPPLRGEPLQESRRRALEHYIEGRSALAEGRFLVAVRALESAAGLDPGSPAIVEELARAYARAGNPTKAAELFEQLLTAVPDHPEALVTLGMRAFDAGDSSASIRRLGTVFRLPEERRRDGYGVFRPGAETASELALARALDRIGADQAVVEVLQRTIARGDAEPTARPMAEARRSLGDALIRLADGPEGLGDIGPAIDAWTGGGRLQPEAWERPLIEPRIAWVLLAAGRESDAMARLRAVLTPLIPESGGDGLRDEDVALAAWLRAVVDEPAPLIDWAAELQTNEPRGATARLAAALDPDQARAILSRAWDDRRPDRGTLQAWLQAAGRIDPAAATADAGRVLEALPWETELVVGCLLRSGLAAATLADPDSYDGSPASIALRARVLTAMNDPGEAWRSLSQPDGSLPADTVRRRAMVEVAGRLDEAMRVEMAAGVAGSVGAISPDDAVGQLELAVAWRRVGESERAVEVAKAAAAAADAAGLVRVQARAMVVAAQAVGDVAARGADRRGAMDALGMAQSAVATDRSCEEAWRLLVGLLDAMAAGDRGGQFRDAARQARAEALASVPRSSLARQLELERTIAEGATVDAVNALNAEVAADPSDPVALQTLINLLQRLGKGDTALAILDERLAVTPADPMAWQLWTESTIAAGHPDDAVIRLEEQSLLAGGNPIVEPLRELALRAADRAADADRLAAARIARLPNSPRRDLERGAQALARGEVEDAVSALRAAAASAAELSPRDALAGAELALRIEGDSVARGELVRAFSQAVLATGETDARTPSVFIARAAALLVLESEPVPESDAERARLVELAVGTARSGLGAAEVPAWFAIGQVFADRERADEGAELLAALLRSDHRVDAVAAARLAMATFALDAAAGGRAERSIALLDLLRSRGVHPFARADRPVGTEADTLQLLAGLYSVVGDRDGSTAILEAAIERDPRHAMSLNNLGYDLLERIRPEERAIELIERAAAVQPDDSAILDTLGWLRYQQGRVADTADGEGALTLLRRAIAAGGEDPGLEPLDHLGDALWRSGDRQGAIKAWQDAQRLAESRYPQAQMVTTLANYERREYGIAVTDGESWWRRNYGVVVERVKGKLSQVARGEQPAIATMRLAARPDQP